ncbi:plasmid maintenance protein [Borreliella lanei]|uniref:plasmid maintenance protein n=1 Tax=Borreliella lanei TaxID=373540 RepID=UPI00161DF5CF
MLNILNSFLKKLGYKDTALRTLRKNLRLLIRDHIIERRILTFQNNINQFKDKLFIYKVKSNAYNLINSYFSSVKIYLIKMKT